MKKEIILKKIIYYADNNDYIIAITENNEKIIGTMKHWLKRESIGYKFEIDGNIKKQKGEEVFEFNNIKLLDDSFLIFLKKNIGYFRTEILREIFLKYNEEKLIDIIENNIQELSSYKYLGTATLNKIQDKWKKQKKLYELSSSLLKLGLTDNMITRIYKYIDFKNILVKDFLNDFNKNPYIITNIELIGFKTADKIALKNGISKESNFRIESALMYSFNEIAKGKGDTAVHLNQLIEVAKELTEQKDINKELIQTCLKNLVEQKEVILLKDDYYSLKKYYDYEDYLLNFLIELRQKEKEPLVVDVEKFIEENENQLNIKLSEEQKDAIRMVNSGVSVFSLCGYAGTGKTTVAKIILNLFKNKNILCTAVSGIATDRIRKATNQNSQIMFGILMNKVNVYNTDVLLIDESSMVNVEQFYFLIKKFEKKKDNIRILFIGDKAQLPPIGAGDFFNDIVENRLCPFIELKTIYRQSKDMILTTFAEKIRNGFIPGGYDKAIYKDFQFITQEVPDFWEKKRKNDKNLPEDKKINQIKTRNIITENYFKNVPKNYKEQLNWFDYVYKNQIITPKKDYHLGVEEINKELQAKLADNSKYISNGFKKFCLYDKVVQTTNKNIETFEGLNLDRAIGSELSTRKIFNGMLGMIIHIDEKEKTFYVIYPTEKIISKYYFKDFNVINLGYAITIHKSQGAEFSNVYIPINYAHFIMLNNKLLYTAITRAKNKVTLVGEKSAFAYACKTSDKIKRFTVIQAMLFYNFI